MSVNEGRVLWVKGDYDFMIQLKAPSLGAYTGLDILASHWDGIWSWGREEANYRVVVPTNLMEWNDENT